MVQNHGINHRRSWIQKQVQHNIALRFTAIAVHRGMNFLDPNKLLKNIQKI